MISRDLLGNKHQKIGELKQKFLMLTDSDLLLLEDKQDEIFVKLHKKHTKTKDVKHWITFEA